MKALLLCSTILLTVSGFYQHKDKAERPPLRCRPYVKTEVAEGITLKLPVSFVAMTESVLSQKYLSARGPIAAYTSQDQQTDLTVNTSNARWQANDLPMLQNFYRSNISALYDEVDFLKEGIEEINGKDFAVFEFISLVLPEENTLSMQKPVRKYTYIAYTIHNGKTYVFNFTAPAQQQKQWQETAIIIINSIKLQ